MKTKKETRGRKTVLDTALTKRICASLAKGCDQKTACNLAGIPYSTYNEWKARGEKGDKPFASFFSVTSRARDVHKANLIAVVLAAADKDARHAEWLLERQFPKEFAHSEARTIDSQKDQAQKPVNVIVRVERDAESDAAVELFGERPSDLKLPGTDGTHG